MLDFSKCPKTKEEHLIVINGDWVNADFVIRSMTMHGFTAKEIPTGEKRKTCDRLGVDINDLLNIADQNGYICSEIIVANIKPEDAYPITQNLFNDPDYIAEQEAGQKTEEALRAAYEHPEEYRGDAFTVFEEEAEKRQQRKNRRLPGQ